jgi:hypothetical protein
MVWVVVNRIPTKDLEQDNSNNTQARQPRIKMQKITTLSFYLFCFVLYTHFLPFPRLGKD